MKDNNITVRVPDFCPEDCLELDCISDKIEYRGEGRAILVDRVFRCRHEDKCRALARTVTRCFLEGEDAGMENRPAEQDWLV